MDRQCSLIPVHLCLWLYLNFSLFLFGGVLHLLAITDVEDCILKVFIFLAIEGDKYCLCLKIFLLQFYYILCCLNLIFSLIRETFEFFVEFVHLLVMNCLEMMVKFLTCIFQIVNHWNLKSLLR